MPADDLVLPLSPDLFGECERVLLRGRGATVSAFRYSSGVAALRLVTRRVELVLLPFRGQQVWRYAVDGEEQTMRTHFDEPAASTVFGETYGGFLLHCGLSGLGAPGPEDRHAHHGELPNAAYDNVELRIGEREGATTVALSGRAAVRTSHAVSATFEPTLTLSTADTALRLTMDVTNLRRTPLEYAYLCHVNWAPVDGARLVQPVTDSGFVVDPHPAQDRATADYTQRIAADPELSNLLDLGQPLVPEYCAILTPTPDEAGWAEFRMVRPDGKLALVGFDTARLPRAIRWISNTGDEEAAGFCLPTTSHHHGRAAAAADGVLALLPPGQTHRLEVVVAVL